MEKQLIKVAKELNLSLHLIAEYLSKKGYEIESKPIAKVSDAMYRDLVREFAKSRTKHAKYLINENLRTKKTSLDLGNCGLMDFQEIPKLFDCLHLETLLLSNMWVEYDNNERMITTSRNNGIDNQLYELSPDFYKLKNLKKLVCAGFGQNQWYIEDISFLQDLKGLTNLNLSNNQITDISFLQNLKKLTDLDLSWNNISNISFLEKLKGLKNLSINNNPFLKTIPLQLKENENHRLTIINHLLKELETNQISIRLPAKILLLGNHGSGKSSFLNYLQNGNLCTETKSTHIINIEKFPQKHQGIPEAIFYDFGGQDYYHGIYRAFLSSGSAHILLWNSYTNQNKESEDTNGLINRNFALSYWLGQKKYIENEKYGGQNDPIILVQTYADIEDSRRVSYCQDTHIIENEFFLSLKSQNIEDNNSINYHALQYLKSFTLSLIKKTQLQIQQPQWYVDFLEYILNQSDTDYNCIPIIEIYQNQYKRQIIEEDAYKLFMDDLEQLHKQGLILYYKNELPDIAWLNPKALVKHIHDNILDKGKIKSSKGKVLPKHFDTFDINIIELLKIHKVIFKHEYGEEGKEYIIPNYLPLANSSGFDYDLFTFGLESPAFILNFEEFLPFGLINQMICHFGRMPDNKKFWRDQLLFTLENKALILIQLNLTDLEIKVYNSFKIGTSENDKIEIQKYLFYSILALYWDMPVLEFSDFMDIELNLSLTKDLRDFSLTKEVHSYKNLFENPNCRPIDLYISFKKNQFVKYVDLCEIKPETTVINTYLKEDKTFKKSIDIPIYPFQIFTNKKFNKMKKIFISYSHFDEEWKDELIKNLAPLRNQDLLLDWNDRKITAGYWDPQIEKAMEEADIFLLLITHNFLASSYITSKEITTAYEQFKAGKTVILPIICDSCEWQLQPLTKSEKVMHPTLHREIYNYLGNFQSFPKNGKPLRNWNNQQDGFVDVIQNLMKYL